jgi:anti-sigma B factor antagonist
LRGFLPVLGMRVIHRACLTPLCKFHSIGGGGFVKSGTMEITVDSRNNVTILRLQGRFIAGEDGPQCREKVKKLIDSGTRKLIFDFSHVPYIDSTGLGFLTSCRAAIQKAGAQLVLVSLDERVRRVLDEVKLSGYFAIAEDEAGGIARLGEMAQA